MHTLSLQDFVPIIMLFLDIYFGDPQCLPHPVQAIGSILNSIAPFALSSKFKKLSGCLAVIFVLCVVEFCIYITTTLSHGAGIVFYLYWSWTGLALGSLLSAGKNAISVIQKGDIYASRREVGFLVSRDTSELSEQSLYRTLAETLSENMNDGVIAPFFWLLIAGPFGLWMYKAISTMDSMWGYKSPTWIDVGFTCAKLDDLLAYIPARLTALFLFCEMIFCHRFYPLSQVSSWPGWKVISLQAKKMESPNAGLPMAVAAWSCNGSMGGEYLYDGKTKEKPLLGPSHSDWNIFSLQLLLAKIRKASIGGGCCLLVFKLLLLNIFQYYK